jgi:hypothetical protein
MRKAEKIGLQFYFELVNNGLFMVCLYGTRSGYGMQCSGSVTFGTDPDADSDPRVRTFD